MRAGSIKPGERFDQLRLAIAFDARDADDLAAAHFKRNVVNTFRAVRISD